MEPNCELHLQNSASAPKYRSLKLINFGFQRVVTGVVTEKRAILCLTLEAVREKTLKLKSTASLVYFDHSATRVRAYDKTNPVASRKHLANGVAKFLGLRRLKPNLQLRLSTYSRTCGGRFVAIRPRI